MKTSFNGDNSQNRGWHSRGYLPHFDSSSVIQTITYRLADSLPLKIIEQSKLDLKMNETKSRAFLDKYLDKGHGACYLKIPQIAKVIKENFQYFDKKSYDLIAWVIMPNHIHVIIQPYEGIHLSEIIKSWKSYTSKESNKVLGRKGQFWFPDYWDRYIRDENHFLSAIDYLHMNPVRAGLVKNPEDWLFSSARKDIMGQVDRGQPVRMRD